MTLTMTAAPVGHGGRRQIRPLSARRQSGPAAAPPPTGCASAAAKVITAIRPYDTDRLVAGRYPPGRVVPPPGSLSDALRHTYATLQPTPASPSPEVQRLLGHADLSTTQVYLKVAGRGLEEAALSNPARALLRPRANP
jgi:hypothetical protein